MTFSIVARDPETGDLGVAVASKFLAVGSAVPWARAGVGAVATQALANVRYGPDGLALLAAGRSAAEALAELIAADEGRTERQLGVVDARGGSDTHTGRGCFAWAGGVAGPDVAAQGNILAGPVVVDALFETFRAGGRPFPEMLLACLLGADSVGGDRRGRESAALLVVREGGGYMGLNDRWIDLRVDDHPDPIPELVRLLDLNRLYMDRPAAADLLPLDETLAGELRIHLAALGAGPGASAAVTYERMWPDEAPAAGADARPTVGSPRPLPVGWDEAWQIALIDWLGVENLEERTTAPGWLDPRVLDYIRGKVRAG
jgi:uncharacterized Ntn-hydrolase superfamily protein